LNLYEDGEPLRLAQDRLGKVDLFFISYDDDFHRADSFGLDGSDQVTSITHAAVLTKYTSAQLSRGFRRFPKPKRGTVTLDLGMALRACGRGCRRALV